MFYRYELYICHSDRTWTPNHFVEVSEEDVHNWDGDMDAMAIDIYKEDNPKADIVLIGVYHVESISEELYTEGVENAV